MCVETSPSSLQERSGKEIKEFRRLTTKERNGIDGRRDTGMAHHNHREAINEFLQMR